MKHDNLVGKDNCNPPLYSECKQIKIGDIDESLLAGWKNPAIPLRQRDLTEQELRQMYNGKVPILFRILETCVKESYNGKCNILELGCATGYYYEVLNYLLDTKIKYTGVDFSENMIELARKYYPDADFVLADGASLPFENEQFSIVISGSILLHNLNYEQHIKETCRVAKDRIIVHRTLICRRRKTILQKKQAYGIDVFEARFNEIELLDLFENNGWEQLMSIGWDIEIYEEDKSEVTYILRRKNV